MDPNLSTRADVLWTAVIAFWAGFGLLVAAVAVLLARPVPSSTLPAPSAPGTRGGPLGESLAAGRLALIASGVTALLGTLWLTDDDGSAAVHALGGGALLLALGICLAHGLRRGILAADRHDDR